MISLKSTFTYKNLVLLVWALIPVGLIVAPFLLSLCMLASVALALYHPERSNRFLIGLRRDWSRQIQGFFRSPHIWTLSVLFFLSLWGFWVLEDAGYQLSRLRIKAPFLVLPFAFFLLPRLDRKTFEGLLLWLLCLLSLTSIGVMINYLFNYSEINLLLEQGQSMPLPSNHIRFSLMLSFGILCAAYLYIYGKLQRQIAWLKYVYLGSGLLLFVFLHFLAVRSGILVTYLTGALLVLQYILRTRQYLLILVLVFSGVAFPFLAYEAFPSVRAKMGYVNYDFEYLRKGNDALQLSDAGRWISLQIGWDVFKSAPVGGVGVGNLKKEVMLRYDQRFPDAPIAQRKMPHNQFLSVLASTGILGFFIFIAAFLFPLFHQKNYQNPLILGFYSIVFLSFMVENTIENAMGAGFFIFYALLLLLSAKLIDDHPQFLGEDGIINP